MTDENLPPYIEPVIITHNVTLESITRNDITVYWPTTAGAASQALLNDGQNNLYWGAGGGGGGNVGTATPFIGSNYLTVTDTTTVSTDIKQTLVSIDGSSNMSNVNILSTNYLNANNAVSLLGAGQLRLSDATNANTISISAPNTLNGSYGLAMPSATPTTLQSLRTSLASASQYEWFSPYSSSPPSISRSIYVANGGSDITGTGSLDQPFASIARAITTANALASAANPVVIQVQPGVYVENNTSGALAITSLGVTISGTQSTAVIIKPLVLSQVLFSFIVNMQLVNVTISCTGVSTAAAINITGSANNSSFNTVQIIGFQTGIYCSTGTGQSLFRNLLIRSCGTSVYVNNCTVIALSPVIQGSVTGTPANTGIYTTGANGKLLISSGSISKCVIAVSFANSSLGGISSISSISNVNDLTATSGATIFVSSVQYTDGTTLDDVTIDVSGTGTVVELSSCNIDGYDYVHNTASGVGISCTSGASVLINSSILQRYTSAIVVGTVSDIIDTSVIVSDVFFTNNINDIIQNNTTKLTVTSSSLALSKLVISSPTNVLLSFSDSVTGASSIGSTAATSVIISQPLQSNILNPTFGYSPSIYNSGSFIEQSVNPLLHVVNSAGVTGTAIVTSNRSSNAYLRLVSDTALSIGTTSALRGWDITKKGSTNAQLDFTFSNTDSNGLPVIIPFVFAEFDAVALTATFAQDAQIILQDGGGGSSNLYTYNNFLQTDSNLLVNGSITSTSLVNNRVLYCVNNTITSSSISVTELNYLSGVTSNLQTQINSKLSLTGGTLTGALALPVGSLGSPSLVFNGTSGLYYSSGINVDINGTAVATFSSSGLALPLLSNGVVHCVNNLLTSSLIIGTDIAQYANIANSSLATLTTSGLVANSATSATSVNTANCIVTRDSNGGFSAGLISADLIGDVTISNSLTFSILDSVLSTDSTGIVTATTLGTGLGLASNILTNTGLLSITGTNITATTVSGAVTVSIPQSVATSSSVQFASILNSSIGTGNIIYGTGALSSASSVGNVAIGTGALGSGTTSANNTITGFNAGLLLTSASNNVLYGAYTTLLSATDTNSIVIGYLASGKGSNTAVYGNGAITSHWFTSGMVYANGLTLTNISPNSGILYATSGVVSALTPAQLTAAVNGLSPSFNLITARGLTLSTLANGLLKVVSGAVVNAVPNSDYQAPMSGSNGIVVSGNTIALSSTPVFNSVTSSQATITNLTATNETVTTLTLATVPNGMLKSAGGIVAQAIANADYQAPLTASGSLSISNNVITNLSANGYFASTNITSNLIYWNSTIISSNVTVANQIVTFGIAGLYEVILSGSVQLNSTSAASALVYINSVQYPSIGATYSLYFSNPQGTGYVSPVSYTAHCRVVAGSTMYVATLGLQGNSAIPTFLTVKWISS